MLSKAVPLFLVFGTALAMMPVKPQVSADRSLVDFMLQTRGVGIGDPALKQYCFNRYLPILKDVSDQYESDYNKCANDYKSECDGIDGKYYEPRENSARTAKETCDALLKCDGNENYADAFDCYASTGSTYSKILFSLSSDASEYGGAIRELYRAAESVAEFCVNYAERVYWESTDKTYTELQSCLDGDINDSTVKSTTTSTTTAKPTTKVAQTTSVTSTSA
ncbi:hypothetical protein AWZ03_004833 [Drosophila navojoa]|uniref:Protein TsetseEP domain-containing protein n=1 Tax=Drosophila navojoa TaxID=7232 RepID=A0A484BLV5_DRONA|nr:uncharacterized protein LOC108655910 [Drosophila navojoa]TDG48721.1 hypothetical protein AWZ03_004833 [Drosophila navojoa]